MSVHLDPAALVSASGAKRLDMLEHLAVCASCRRAVAESDPGALFGLLALAPIPAAVLDDVSAGVAHHVGRDRTPLGWFARAEAWPKSAAAAAAVALAIVCGYAVLQQPPAAPPALSMAHPRADVDVDTARGVSQVIDLTVGETQIVMVYNRDLKL